MKKFKNTDVLIVGSGIAGLSTALQLPHNHKIVLITKGQINECSTSWAQGGIASVTSKSDSFEKHLDDVKLNFSDVVEMSPNLLEGV